MIRLLLLITLLCPVCYAQDLDISPNAVYKVMDKEKFDKEIQKSMHTYFTEWSRLRSIIEKDDTLDFTKYWSIDVDYKHICDLYDARKEVNPFLSLMPIYQEYHAAIKENNKVKILAVMDKGLTAFKDMAAKIYGKKEADVFLNITEKDKAITSKDITLYKVMPVEKPVERKNLLADIR